MSNNVYEQVNFPQNNCIDSSKLATKCQAVTTIVISFVLLISFIIVNFFFSEQMMDWSIKTSEAMIEYDPVHLNV